jgi:biotin transport system substrate-specific component
VPTLAYSIPGVRSNLAYDALLVTLGSLVVAALAQLSIDLPITPVPITGQTLGVLLVGASLGALRGGLALALYLLEGAIGLPFYAEGNSGLEYLTTLDRLFVSGGYLWGFVVAAALVGFLAEKGWDRRLGSAIGAMVIGEIVIFFFGVLGVAAALDVPVIGAVDQYDDALDFGLYPFVIGDLLKLLIAAGALPSAWKLLGREPRT